MKEKARKYKIHIGVAVAAIVYAILDLKLATGFVVGISAGLLLADEMKDRANERYEAWKRKRGYS